MCWKYLGLIIVTVVAASPLHARLSVDPVAIAKWKDCTNNTAKELTKKVGQEVFLRRANVVGSLAEVTLAQCGYELAIARSGLSDGAVNKLIHDQRKILKQSIAKQLDSYDIEGL